MLRLWKALALIPILCGGCDFFSAETDLDNACVTLENQTIDGVPIDKLTRSFSYDQLAVLDGFIALDAEVSKIKIDLKAVSGVEDLSFLDSVHIAVATEGLPEIEVLSCEAGACASDTMQSSVEVAAPANLTKYALGGRVNITITVEGPMPRNAWVADLKICLSGSAKVSAGF